MFYAPRLLALIGALALIIPVLLIACRSPDEPSSPRTTERDKERSGAEEDRKVLVALHDATGGPNWESKGNWLSRNWVSDNWLSDAPIGEWDGVHIDASGYLTALSLYSNRLSEEIPVTLSNLVNLEVLDLHLNNLSGEIPPELGRLTNLEDLDLSSNDLSGEIPPEVGHLANLNVLTLGHNRLSGEIPAELGSLANLENLYLNDNRLSGKIPAELGHLANLEQLYLNDNLLNGEIPLELGHLDNLIWLYLFNNRLSGEIPVELGHLDNLTVLHLDGNQLSGCIPSALRDQLAMRWSDLGGLPFCRPAKLAAAEPAKPAPAPNVSLETVKKTLTAFYRATDGPNWRRNENWLSGAPVGEWHGVTTDASGRLTRLEIEINDLNGEIPEELVNLANLKWLFLGGNELLSGEIPAELGNMTSLERLDIYDNQLSGCIPGTLRDRLNMAFSNLGDLSFC